LPQAFAAFWRSSLPSSYILGAVAWLQMLRGALAGRFCGTVAAFLDLFSWLGFLVSSGSYLRGQSLL